VTDEPFTTANGLLGNTMKLKRHAVLQRYAAALDAQVRAWAWS